jgi:cyclopropane-fatty-acyl-phospholipid synthase
MDAAAPLPVPGLVDTLVEARILPDAVARAAIRRIVAGRLRDQRAGGLEAQSQRASALRQRMAAAPVAVAAAAANAQHYEVPAEFFALVLGPHMKYSSAWWPDGVATLEAAEGAMLDLSMQRADLHDGQAVLDLGCGWGSFVLAAAARHRRSRFLAVSNSAPQRRHIEAQAAARGLSNVDVITTDVNSFTPDRRFDRIVSIEMLEHVRNHAAVFARLAEWLHPDGRFFAHVFAHRQFAYLYEDRGAGDWMARHFFTGGMMPSDDWFLHLQQDLIVERHWRLDGTHYQRTAEAWLGNLDRRRDAVERVLAASYGASMAPRLRARWRMFFMACAEMFGYGRGQEWLVSHYRFRRRS